MLLSPPIIVVMLCLTLSTQVTPRKICKDHHRYCKKIGKSRPASRCYRKSVERECCATCRALRDDMSPGCEFGDLEVWCASIGKRYAASSCYDNEHSCCRTCSLVKSDIPGCPYGDKVLWCRNIGKFYSPDQCKGHGNETCCDTCYKIFHKDDFITSESSFIASTTTTTIGVQVVQTVKASVLPTPYIHSTVNSKPESMEDTKQPSMDSSQPGDYGGASPDLLHKATDISTVKTPKELTSRGPSILTQSLNETSYSIAKDDGGERVNISSSDTEGEREDHIDMIPVSTEVAADANLEISKGTTAEDQAVKTPGLHIVSIDNSKNRTKNPKFAQNSDDKHILPEEGTTDDEDLLIEGSADYDNELPRYHHKGHGHHKNHHHNRENDYHKPGDLKYPDRESDVDYILYDHALSSAERVVASVWLGLLLSTACTVMLAFLTSTRTSSLITKMV